MPYHNSPQQNPRDARLAELAAIAQLYGAVSGPQEQAARAQQQNALAVLGLMQQAQSQQAHEAFQQQQLQQQGGFQQQQLGLEGQRVGLEKTRSEQVAAHEGRVEGLEAQRFGLVKTEADNAAKQRAADDWYKADANRADWQRQQDAVAHGNKMLTLAGDEKEQALANDLMKQRLLLQTPEAKHEFDLMASRLSPKHYGPALEQMNTTLRAEDMPGARTAFKQVMGTSDKARDAAWQMKAAQHPAMSYLNFSDPTLYQGQTTQPSNAPTGVPSTADVAHGINSLASYIGNAGIDLLNLPAFVGNVGGQATVGHDLFRYFPKYK